QRDRPSARADDELRGLGEPLLRARREHELVAGARELERDGATDAARRAGDEGEPHFGDRRVVVLRVVAARVDARVTGVLRTAVAGGFTDPTAGLRRRACGETDGVSAAAAAAAV